MIYKEVSAFQDNTAPCEHFHRTLMVGGTIHFKCQSLTSTSLLDAAKENMYVLYPKMSYV